MARTAWPTAPRFCERPRDPGEAVRRVEPPAPFRLSARGAPPHRAGVSIQVERMTPSLFPILSYNVEGGDPATLYDIARYQIKPIVSRVPGVGRVDVLGSDVREIEVVADPGRLAQQAMTFDDLAAAIRDATTVTAVGRMPRDYRQYLMVSATEAHGLH